MDIHVEDIGPCKKLLKIEVPPERVDEELEKAYDQMNETVAFPGFRKGHVPRWLMRGKFGKQVNADTKESLIVESFDAAVKEHELRPIGKPSFDEEIVFEPGKPLAFGVTVEVQPEFEIEDYSGVEVKRASCEPTKAELKERTEALQKRYAKMEAVQKGSPKKEDVVLCHVVLTEGSETYRDIPDHQFVVGAHALVGLTGDETAGLITRAKPGEPIEKDVVLPDDYVDEAKRGAAMRLSLTLTGIRRPVLPELTEAWAEEIGFESLEGLREEIGAAVRREKEQAADKELQEQLSDKLAKLVDFELPEDIIADMAERSAVRQSLRLRYEGVPVAEIETHLDEIRKASRESAERAAKLFFIFSKIADKERLFVTEDEVTARIEAIAANYGRSPEQIRRDLESNDRLAELRSSMREEKVREFLLDKAVVKGSKSSRKLRKSDT